MRRLGTLRLMMGRRYTLQRDLWTPPPGLWTPLAHLDGTTVASGITVFPTQYVRAFDSGQLMAAVPADPTIATDIDFDDNLTRLGTLFAVDTSTVWYGATTLSATCLTQTTVTTAAGVVPPLLRSSVFEMRGVPYGLGEFAGWRAAWDLILQSPTYTSGNTVGVVIDAKRSDYQMWNARAAKIPVIGRLPERITLVYAADDARGTWANRLLHVADGGARRQRMLAIKNRDPRPVIAAPVDALYTAFRPWRCDCAKARAHWDKVALLR